MISRRSIVSIGGSALLAAAFAAPALAQSSSAPASVVPDAPPASIPAGPAINVVATDYHFGGLPTTVPVGTTLTLDNQGVEVHELIVVRKNDGVTQSWEELLGMPDSEVFEYITIINPEPLFAAPGETAPGGIVIPQVGEYFAICFVPQGMTAFPDPSASLDPALASATPHFMLGMMQEFSVTEAGTEVGPLPSGAPVDPAGSTAP